MINFEFYLIRHNWNIYTVKTKKKYIYIYFEMFLEFWNYWYTRLKLLIYKVR